MPTSPLPVLRRFHRARQSLDSVRRSPHQSARRLIQSARLLIQFTSCPNRCCSCRCDTSGGQSSGHVVHAAGADRSNVGPDFMKKSDNDTRRVDKVHFFMMARISERMQWRPRGPRGELFCARGEVLPARKFLARSRHISAPPSETVGVARPIPSSSHRRAVADRRTA